MQNIINGIDKATKAGVFSLDEVLTIAKSLEGLGQIVQQHHASQNAAKELVPSPQGPEVELPATKNTPVRKTPAKKS